MHLQRSKLLRATIQEGKHLQESTYLTLTLEIKITQNVAQYPLHYVNYAPAKFEAATSNSLGADAFTIKYII